MSEWPIVGLPALGSYSTKRYALQVNFRKRKRRRKRVGQCGGGEKKEKDGSSNGSDNEKGLIRS